MKSFSDCQRGGSWERGGLAERATLKGSRRHRTKGKENRENVRSGQVKSKREGSQDSLNEERGAAGYYMEGVRESWLLNEEREEGAVGFFVTIRVYILMRP
jgi:hypothetical protein